MKAPNRTNGLLRLALFPLPLLVIALHALAGPGGWDQTYAPAVTGGAVNAMAMQPDGKLLIGGAFTAVNNSSSRARLARLFADGSLDTSFFNTGSGVAGTVWCLAVQTDGRIVLGGDITGVNGTARTRVARLNSNGTVDGGFVPTNTINISVLAVAAQSDNKVIIGGSFSGGTFPSWNARLNADGTTDTAFSSFPNGAVNAIAIQMDGKILIGGAFTTVNGATRNRVARLNPDGSLDNTFQNGMTGASQPVRCLQIQTDGKILIGGDFTSVNGTNRSYVARLNSNGSLDTGFSSSQGADASVYALALQPDSSVVIGGTFSTYAAASLSRVARLYADGTRDTTFTNFGINNIVRALAVQSDGGLLVGGTFTTINNTNRLSLGRLYGNLYPPEFVTQPVSLATNVGANVTFSAQVNNPTPSNFQWRKDGNNLAGATGTSYTLYNVQFADAGNYSVFVSNAGGGTTSSNAVLSVGVAPTLQGQPVSLVVTQGESATFTVTATGTPLNYFWKKDGLFIPGATNSSYLLASVVAGNAAAYACQVSNFLGSVTSSSAVLTVIVPASITVQPASQIVGEGSNATFTVTAAGSALTYQWFKGDTIIPGAAAASFDINNAQFSDAADYTVTVSNNLTVVTSQVATLTVQRYAPAITLQPTSQNIPVGSNVTFAVEATGTTLNYQWLKDATNILDSTDPTLSLTNVSLGDVGGYSVIIANPVGSVTSVVANLNVGYTPFIVQQPQPFTNALATSNAFNVTVSGTEPFIYQWFKDDVAIADATNSLLALPNLQASQVGYYSVNITNLYGWAASSSALITALYPPTITAQPVGQTLLVGSNFTLTVTATGTDPLAYQWRKNENNLSGEVGPSYTVTGADTNDTGTYMVVVTNMAGSVTSVVAQVNVGYAPLILQQPQSFTNNLGESNAFSVVTSGSEPLLYQWFKDGLMIADATNSLLPLSNLQSNQVGYYSVTVTNLYGWTASSNALLSIPGVPLPTYWQGLVAYYPFNGNAQDETGNGHNGTVSYALQTTDRLGMANAAFAFDGVSSVITVPHDDVFNFRSNVDFAISVWAVLNAPAGVSPQFYLVGKGPGTGDETKWMFGFGATSDYQAFRNLYFFFTDPSLHWLGDGQSYTVQPNTWHHYALTKAGSTYSIYVDGKLFSSEASSSQITRGNTAPLRIGRVENLSVNGKLDDVRIYNRSLTLNEVAQLYALECDMPVIIRQPQGAVVTQGAAVSFVVAATAQNPLTYQWSKDGVPVAAATNATLLMANVQPAQAGLYTVAISNGFTGVVSTSAALALMSSTGPGAPGFTGNQFGFGISGPQGSLFVMDASTNLTSWQAIATNVFGAGMFLFLDPASSTNAMSFYRVVLH